MHDGCQRQGQSGLSSPGLKPGAPSPAIGERRNTTCRSERCDSNWMSLAVNTNRLKRERLRTELVELIRLCTDRKKSSAHRNEFRSTCRRRSVVGIPRGYGQRTFGSGYGAKQGHCVDGL